ncbi:hypothetical protein [Natrinema sp. CBA1119]|uniref:hypothetical protein n=1 Tax=Natrinema sp. CBA1119 TaxID=1608465 RepID=UPI001145AABC|nr:hypothetical protein [Natrinema sp. CBA1119]
MDNNTVQRSERGSQVNRRGLLHSIGTATLSGTAILGLSGSVSATHTCPDLDISGEAYEDCDDASEEINYAYRRDTTRVKGETSLSVGSRGWTDNNCNECVTYFFDLAGLNEAYGTDNGNEYVNSFGFRWEVSDSVIPDPQPAGSSNLESGVIDPDGTESPNGNDEEAFYALGDVAIGGGTLLYPALGPTAFLYTLARASSIDSSIDEANNEVAFNDGLIPSHFDSVGYGYYNMRFQLPLHEEGTVTFEAFTDTGNREVTTSTKTFNLDSHVYYTGPVGPNP